MNINKKYFTQFNMGGTGTLDEYDLTASQFVNPFVKFIGVNNIAITKVLFNVRLTVRTMPDPDDPGGFLFKQISLPTNTIQVLLRNFDKINNRIICQNGADLYLTVNPPENPNVQLRIADPFATNALILTSTEPDEYDNITIPSVITEINVSGTIEYELI